MRLFTKNTSFYVIFFEFGRRNLQCGLTLHFNKGLNVLIGENNTSKTAIVDALRICLSYGNQKRDIYVTKSDFHIDRTTITETLNDY